MSKDIIQVHREIISILKNKFVKNVCVLIIDIAKEVKMDKRTVRRHLKIAEIDGVGYFGDSDKNIFCESNTEVN